jgi:3-methylcrotonyl-CoA carboxylase alpha subunit
MSSQAQFRGRTVDVDIVRRRPNLALRIGGRLHEIREIAAADGAIEIEIDGKVFRGWRYVAGNEIYLRLDGRSFHVTLVDHRSSGRAAGKTGDALYADKPGTVIDVRCAPGDAVVTGQALMTIESMKLQMTIVAPFDGIVAIVHVAPQTSFERDALLISLKPAATQGE